MLRRIGVAGPALRLYEGIVLRRGTHSFMHDGSRRKFVAHDRFDVLRVDNFLGLERVFIDRILRSIVAGDIVFDVGANIGIVSVLIAASKRDSGVAVHAFEPNPESARRVRENALLNRCENVTVHTVALGRENAAARLYTCRGDCGRDSMILHSVTEAAGIDIRVERGDEVPGRLGVEPSVVKIDVEGAEMDVLIGMENLFLRNVVRELFIEVHPPLLKVAGYDERRLAGWLESRGFRRIWQEPRGGEIHEHFRRCRS